MPRLKVAAFQAPLLPSGRMQSIALVAAVVRRCEAEGIDILCCPEALLGGLADDSERPDDLALTDGELEALLAPIGSGGVTTIVGFSERGEGGNLYNSAAVFNGGSIAGIYRKRHPAIRKSIYSPGTDSPVFAAAGAAFGILVCNDSNYPGLARDLVSRGAQLLFVPSNNALRPGKAEVVDASRAADAALATANKVPVVRADVAGKTAVRVSVGSSAITAADGSMIRAGEPFSEGLLIAELELPLRPSLQAASSRTSA